MRKNTKRAIAIGAGLAGLGALGYSALPLQEGREIEREIPLQITRRMDLTEPDGTYHPSKTLAYLIDFNGTSEELSSQNPSVADDAFWKNSSWDIIAFYSLPSQYEIGFDKTQKAVKEGVYSLEGIYISKNLADRLATNDRYREKITPLLGDSFDKKGYQIMTEEQRKTKAMEVFSTFNDLSDPIH